MKIHHLAMLASYLLLSACIDTNRNGIDDIECVLDVSNIFVETPKGKENLPSWKQGRVKTFLKKFSKRHFPVVPATDRRDINHRIIHYFVLSYDDCNTSSEEIETYFAKKNLTVPDIRISSMDEYKQVFQGIQIFETK